jgi:hypothetical protein
MTDIVRGRNKRNVEPHNSRHHDVGLEAEVEDGEARERRAVRRRTGVVGHDGGVDSARVGQVRRNCRLAVLDIREERVQTRIECEVAETSISWYGEANKRRRLRGRRRGGSVVERDADLASDGRSGRREREGRERGDRKGWITRRARRDELRSNREDAAEAEGSVVGGVPRGTLLDGRCDPSIMAGFGRQDRAGGREVRLVGDERRSAEVG